MIWIIYLAIENGKYSPTLELTFRITDVFETKIEEVFSYEIIEDKIKGRMILNDK